MFKWLNTPKYSKGFRYLNLPSIDGQFLPILLQRNLILVTKRRDRKRSAILQPSKVQVLNLWQLKETTKQPSKPGESSSRREYQEGDCFLSPLSRIRCKTGAPGNFLRNIQASLSFWMPARLRKVLWVVVLDSMSKSHIKPTQEIWLPLLNWFCFLLLFPDNLHIYIYIP